MDNIKIIESHHMVKTVPVFTERYKKRVKNKPWIKAKIVTAPSD